MVSFRILPEDELSWVVKHLGHYFSCNHHNLPTEWLTHKFLWGFAGQTKRMDPYRKCLHNITKITASSNQNSYCTDITSKVCPHRFGIDHTRHEYCRDQLLEENTVMRDVSITKYLECRKNLHSHIESCVLDLNTQCKQSDIVAIKSVRLTMDAVERLLEHIPDLKVIHYIRDPRAVALSRQMDESMRGIYALKGSPISKAGQLYCPNLMRDLKKSHALQKLYPESILELYYEELATFPDLIATRIYEFIGREVPQTLKYWIGNNTDSGNKGWTSRNSVDIVTKWTKHVDEDTKNQINEYCREVFKTVKIKWTQTNL